MKPIQAATKILRAMSPEEFKASLIRLGILTKGGKLTKAYQQPKSKK